MKTFPINELFYSWQGEGTHSGRPAFFIRLQGCPVKCAWCDSASTWHPDHIPDDIEKLSIEQLVGEAVKHNPDFVVITGGEPTIYDLSRLVVALKAYDLPAHLETCGAYEIKGDFDWITLSPKFAQLPLTENIHAADELKLIVDTPDAIDLWEAELGDLLKHKPVWLHPEWSQRSNPDILSIINLKVKNSPFDYRAGYQLHKLFHVDEEDSRCRESKRATNKPRHLFGKTQNISLHPILKI